MTLLQCATLKFALVHQICTPKKTSAYTIWHNHMSICPWSNSFDSPIFTSKPPCISLQHPYSSRMMRTCTYYHGIRFCELYSSYVGSLVDGVRCVVQCSLWFLLHVVLLWSALWFRAELHYFGAWVLIALLACAKNSNCKKNKNFFVKFC